MSQRIPVGVLGATGMVGQHFVKFLANHPWFQITFVGASDRSAGKKYNEATSWRLAGEMPNEVAGLTVSECKPVNAPKIVFSAMDASVATEIAVMVIGGHLLEQLAVEIGLNHRRRERPIDRFGINAYALQVMLIHSFAGYIVVLRRCSLLIRIGRGQRSD